jgi:hypothetical protein
LVKPGITFLKASLCLLSSLLPFINSEATGPKRTRLPAAIWGGGALDDYKCIAFPETLRLDSSPLFPVLTMTHRRRFLLGPPIRGF